MHTLVGQRLESLALRSPGAAKVFHRYGLDFCCGGARTLKEACEKAQLDVAAVVASIEDEARRGAPIEVDWSTAPVAALIEHILITHHVPLPADLDRVVAMSEKVARVHGEKDPVRLTRLVEVVRALRDDLLPHMMKEEQVLFPWILSGRAPAPAMPITVMRHEHDAVAQLLHELTALTESFTPPDGACTTWRALYAGLLALDLDLRTHMHLENNVLFPRVLEGHALHA